MKFKNAQSLLQKVQTQWYLLKIPNSFSSREEEEQYLSNIIRELKMNFVEEKNNPEESNSSQSGEEKSKDESDLKPEKNNTNGKAEDERIDKTEVKKD